jgi:O-antigen/teichoic acid export membrane protein
MMLRHSALYFLARGGPGLLNFVGIAVFTRLLAPGDYGWYALVITAVTVANAVAFQWLRLGLLRFLPAYKGKDTEFLSTIVLGFACVMAISGVAAAISCVAVSDSTSRALILAGTVLLWGQAWYDMNLELIRSELLPKTYGLISLGRAVLTLCLGVLMVYLGYGAMGLLFASLVGMVLPVLNPSFARWRTCRLGKVDRVALSSLLRYGLPLTVNFALGYTVASSDRLFLAWLNGPRDVGLYSSGYDLAQQSLVMLMLVINLAAYPLVIRALEERGLDAAKRQLEQYAGLLFAIALPAVAGLSILAPNIALVVLGEQYREAGGVLIPWISWAAMLFGMKIYYFDLSFQLGKNTWGQTSIAAVAAFVNIGFNFMLIPSLGGMGAAYSTIIAYAVACGLSWLVGRRVFNMPLPTRMGVKIMAATAFMIICLIPIRNVTGLWGLLGQVTLGALAYGATLVLLNGFGLRTLVVKWLRLPLGGMWGGDDA